MMCRRRSAIWFFLPLATLMLLTGCGKKPIRISPADDALLSAMAEARRGEVGHALLVSRSGLVASLPIQDLSSKPLPVPGRGLFFGEYRLLDGWHYEAGARGETDPGALAVQRPDYVERPVEGIGTERIVLDPDSASGIIFLTEGPGELVRFIPRFDLRPIRQISSEARFNYHSSARALIGSLGADGLYLAMVSTGEYAEGRQTERIDYVSGFGVLEPVASTIEPGLFAFPRAKGSAVAFAVSDTPDRATRLAFRALEHRDDLMERARNRVLNTLDKVVFRSEDPSLAGAANWDIWWTLEGLFVGHNAEAVRLARPPLPYTADLVAETNTLPVLLACNPSDLGPAGAVIENLNEASARSDLEGYSYALNHILSDRLFFSWLVDDSLLIEQAHILAQVSPDLRVDLDSIQFDLETRWDMDLQEAELEHPWEMTQSGIGWMLHDAMQLIVDPMARLRLYTEDFSLLESYLSFRNTDRDLILSPVLLTPPDVWTPRLIEAYKEATSNPQLNLATYERRSNLRRTRDEVPAAETILRLFADVDGLRFHNSDAYKSVAFNPQRWLAWHKQFPGQGGFPDIERDAYLSPAYSTWQVHFEGTEEVLHGGAVVDQEVTARRLMVLINDLIGLQWNINPAKAGNTESDGSRPLVTGFSLKPTGPLEFWKGRAVSFAIGEDPSRIMVEMDPHRGHYRFELEQGGRTMQVSLIDVPVGEQQLIGNFTLQAGLPMEVTRENGGAGRATFFLNGTELRNVSRQMVR